MSPDRNFHSIVDRHNETITWSVPHAEIGDPLQWDDVLKITRCSNLTVVVDGPLPGGREDCIDVNNKCENIRIIIAGGLAPKGKHALTIKGKSHGISVHAKLLSHGTEVDVDLGNHSDQSDERTDDVLLDLWAIDNTPVTWRRLNAATPKFLNPREQKYRRTFRIRGFFRSIFAKGYALLKRLGVPI